MPAEAQPEPLTRAVTVTEQDGVGVVTAAPLGSPDGAPAGVEPYLLARTFTAPAPTRALTGATPLVTVDDVVTLGGLGVLSDVARAALGAHLDGLLASLELRLNRALSVREFTDDVVIGEDGRLWLTQSPVQAITAVIAHDQLGVFPMPTITDPRVYSWRPGLTVRVTYTAGLNADRYGPVVKAVVATKALPWARALLARLSATPDPADPAAGDGQLVIPGRSPGVASFSVEGLNVTYETDAAAVEAAVRAAQAEAAAALWTDVELASMGQLRRPVVA